MQDTSVTVEMSEKASMREEAGESVGKRSVGKRAHSLLRASRSVANLKNLEARMRWIIFPDNRLLQKWDFWMMIQLVLLAFYLPYQIGVSGGYCLLQSTTWAVFNVLFNTCFFIDTFLYFFRAYYDENGRLVFDSKKIRSSYIKSYFFPNLIAVLPTTLPFIVLVKNPPVSGDASDVYDLLILLKILDIFKLVRFARVPIILNTSHSVNKLRNKYPHEFIRLWFFIFAIVMVCHWFACIWCFVAFMEVGSFAESRMEAKLNWIWNWYSANQSGGIDPIGWANHLDRYVLSLFWSIQTITSIGYGNISPVTRAEWWVGSVLMLLSGIVWAYVIGSTVSLAAAIQEANLEHRAHVDHANQLLRRIEAVSDQKDATANKEFARQLREYLRTKHQRSTFLPLHSRKSFVENFPILESLPSDLKGAACLKLCKRAVESVPYLSSKYLDEVTQNMVASCCEMISFASGSRVVINCVGESEARGIYFFTMGSAFYGWENHYCNPIAEGRAMSAHVLLEDDLAFRTPITISFLTYSELIFIPREAVLLALQRCPSAWSHCARRKYAMECITAKVVANRASGPADV